MAKNNTTVDRIQAIWNMIGGDDMVDALIEGRAELKATMIKLFEWVSVVKIPATTKKFIANRNFNRLRSSGICSQFNSDFVSWFLSDSGKIEGSTDQRVISYGALSEFSVDSKIINLLGGEKKCETLLTDMCDLMLKQSKGEEDHVLLTNGRQNVFFIRDIFGELRLVILFWKYNGWAIYAFVIGQRGINLGNHVFYQGP